MDSTKDDVNQLKNNYKQYAEAVVRALSNYKGIKYVPPVDSGYYIVKKGDSLWSIATNNGITVEELKKLNNLTTNNITVGQSLKVGTPEEEKITSDYLIYTVKGGDSLYKIADEYNTTIQTIKDINNLSGDFLTINQQLLLPKTENIEIDVKPQESIKYTVKSGDSLYKIAQNYNTTVEKIKNYNNLKTNTLQIGEKLIIPISTTVVEEKKEIASNGINYVVVKGDNLYTIANKYGVTIDDIKKSNNLSNNLLQIGQVLIIPGTSNYATYTVKKGDTLYKIANLYGTTVQNLKTINNLETINLGVGQELLIPSN